LPLRIAIIAHFKQILQCQSCQNEHNIRRSCYLNYKI